LLEGTSSLIEIVCKLQPVSDLIVDVVRRGNGNSVGDSVFLCEPAGVYEPARRFQILQGEAHVYSSASRRLDLCKYMVAIERHDGFAWASLNVPGNPQAEHEELIVERAQ